MLDVVRSWLNGSRDYKMGVAIYLQIGNNDALKKLFYNKSTNFCKQKLVDELHKIYLPLKEKENASNLQRSTTSSMEEKSENKKSARDEYFKPDIATKENVIAETESNSDAVINEALFVAAKSDANKAYKLAMNKRAVLFNMIPSNAFEQSNKPDLIAARSALAVEVVTLYNEASRLYDVADYVKINGQLPDINISNDMANIPDELVYKTLDNKRKNYNKILKKEKTAKIIAAIQQYEFDINILKERWQLLKQK